MAIDSILSRGSASIHIEPDESLHLRQSSSQTHQELVQAQQPIRLTASVPVSADGPAHRRLIAADLNEISNTLVEHLSSKSRGIVDRMERKWSDSSADKRELKRLINARNVLNSHVVSLLNQYPRDEATGKISANTILSIEDAAKISRAYEVAARLLPKGETRELTGLLGQHIKAAWEQMKVDELKAQTVRELEPYRKPETFKSDQVSIEGKYAIGAPIIEVNEFKLAPLSLAVRHTLGLSKKDELLTDPEGIVFLNKHSIKNSNKKGDLGIEISKIVKAKLEGGINLSKDDVKLEMFNSIEDLVEKKAHTQRFNKANRDEYKGILKLGKWDKAQQILKDAFDQKRFPGTSELANLKVDQQHATDNQERLNFLLQNVLNLQSADINAPAPDRGRALAGHSTTVTATGVGTGGAGAFGVEGDINISVSRSLFDFHVYAPSQFSDVILKNAQRLEELPAKLTQHARESLQHTEVGASERQQTATSKLQDLNTDLKKYYRVVKELDGLRHRQASNLVVKDSRQEKELVSEKHHIENKWNAIGRHNLLQTLSASHALLAINAMPPGGGHSDETMRVVKEAADTLKNPDIRYDKKRLNEAAAFKKDIILQNRSTKVSAGGEISAYGQSGSLTYTHEWLNRIHPSRVRQGDYVNKTWTATGTLTANGPVTELAQRLEGAAGVENTAGSVQEALANILTGDTTNAYYSISRSRITRDFHPDYRNDMNYEGSKKYDRQFTRTTQTISYGANGGGIGPAAPGLNVGGNVGYEHSESTMKGQKLGADGLTFALNMLNRMDKNKATNPGALDKFFEENKVEFGHIFKNLGDPSSRAHSEIQYFLNELVERAPESEKNLAINALDVIFSGGPRVSQKDAAIEALRVLTSRNSSNEEKDRAQEIIRESIKSIPWNNIKEATPPKSTLATLGFSGKKVFGVKVTPGESPSTKLEKAEKALKTLSKARDAGLFSAESQKKPGSVQQDAIKTLTQLFGSLGMEAEYDKARDMLSALLKKVESGTEAYAIAEDSLNAMIHADSAISSSSGDPDAVKQRSRERLADFIDQYADNSGKKDEARLFADKFNRIMADFRADPSPANLNKAKEVFFEYHQQQMVPWNESHMSTWVDVPFTKGQAKQALDLGTRVLKGMGVHPRTREQRQMQPHQASDTGNVMTSSQPNVDRNSGSIETSQDQEVRNVRPEPPKKNWKSTLTSFFRSSTNKTHLDSVRVAVSATPQNSRPPSPESPPQTPPLAMDTVGTVRQQTTLPPQTHPEHVSEARDESIYKPPGEEEGIRYARDFYRR